MKSDPPTARVKVRAVGGKIAAAQEEEAERAEFKRRPCVGHWGWMKVAVESPTIWFALYVLYCRMSVDLYHCSQPLPGNQKFR